MAQPPKLDTLKLTVWTHRTREQGMCLSEAVAWFGGEPHTQKPRSADVALIAAGDALNDGLEDDERQQLRPLVPRLVATASSTDVARRRATFLADRHLRSTLPAFLRELPGAARADLAARLEQLAPVKDDLTAARALEAVRQISDAIYDGRTRPPTPVGDAARAAAAIITSAEAASAAAFEADKLEEVREALYTTRSLARYAAAAASGDEQLRVVRRQTVARTVAAFAESIGVT